MRTVFIILGFLFFWGCTNQQKCSPTEAVESLPFHLQRAEQKLFMASNEQEVVTFLQEHPVISEAFLHAGEYPNLDILAERLYKLTNDPFIDTLYQESIETFNQNLDRFEDQYTTAQSRLKYFFPQSRNLHLKTMVTGLYNDVVITDSLVILGIDFFIGEEASYRPNNIPNYILERYNYDYVVPTVFKFIASSYSRNGDENSLLSEMIDFGKIYYLLEQLLPCTEKHLLIGFKAQEWRDVLANQEIIWANFIENKLLYETSEVTKRKFLGERPVVFEIGDKCPGRIGAWVGWEIVKAYMEKNNVSLQELLQETDHHKIFTQSQYKPSNQRN